MAALSFFRLSALMVGRRKPQTIKVEANARRMNPLFFTARTAP
jgi:hypothetical protein